LKQRLAELAVAAAKHHSFFTAHYPKLKRLLTKMQPLIGDFKYINKIAKRAMLYNHRVAYKEKHLKKNIVNNFSCYILKIFRQYVI
jgi:hypothetical protein